jgi:hypothetical protein
MVDIELRDTRLPTDIKKKQTCRLNFSSGQFDSSVQTSRNLGLKAGTGYKKRKHWKNGRLGNFFYLLYLR